MEPEMLLAWSSLSTGIRCCFESQGLEGRRGIEMDILVLASHPFPSILFMTSVSLNKNLVHDYLKAEDLLGMEMPFSNRQE